MRARSVSSGEPYIFHPLAVARILGEMRMDYKCLIAALLHDVIEDTPVGKEQLAAVFDDEIAELVDGVSKLSQIDFESRAEAQAASLQKMLLAMTRDIRVILIKLADRPHNMRTLGVMKAESRRRISRETLEIFAPIANRLGINSIRVELEELGFSHYWPWRHLVLQRAVQKASGARSELLATVEAAIKRRLQQEAIPGEVTGRRKNLYSIYRKMRDKRRSFSDLVDVFGLRVTVDRVDTCYRVLGQVHNLYKPVPGRFKDYIAIPKANGYQSLHTVLFGPQGVPDRGPDPHRRPCSAAPSPASPPTGCTRAAAQNAAPRPGPGQGVAPEPAGDAAQRRQLGGVPGTRQGRPVPGGGLCLHPQGPHPHPQARGHGGGLRLCHPLGRGQHLRGRAHRPAHGGAQHPAAQRSDGGDHHRPGGQAQPDLAQFRGHRQGAGQHPRLPQEPQATGGRGPGPAPVERGTGHPGHRDRPSWTRGASPPI